MHFPYRQLIIDETGSVWRRFKKGCRPTGHIEPDGYWYVCIGNDGYRRRSRLVYMWFHGPVPKGYDVHHKDKNRQNDDPMNLELKTKSQHQIDHNVGRVYVKRITWITEKDRRIQKWNMHRELRNLEHILLFGHASLCIEVDFRAGYKVLAEKIYTNIRVLHKEHKK